MRACFVLLSLAAIPATSEAQSLLDAPLRTIVPIRTLDGIKENFSRLDRWWVTASRAGNPVVLDGAVIQLRFYQMSGQAPSLVGRRGQGPGEFRGNALSIGWIADTLWIYDPGNNRLTFFTKAGKELRETPMPRFTQAVDVVGDPSKVLVGRVLAILPDHSMLREGTTPVDRLLSTVIVHAAADGKIDRVVASVPMQPPAASIPVNQPDGSPGGTQSISAPFPDPVSSQFSVSPDGGWVVTKRIAMGTGNNGQIQVAAVAADGKTIFSRSYLFTGTPIPDSIKNRQRSSSIPPAVQKLVLAAMPKVYPPVEVLLAGRDSTTWLQFRETKAGTPMVMLDRRGTPQLRVNVPGKKVQLVLASSTMIWVITHDDDDIPSVVGYRLQR